MKQELDEGKYHRTVGKSRGKNVISEAAETLGNKAPGSGNTQEKQEVFDDGLCSRIFENAL